MISGFKKENKGGLFKSHKKVYVFKKIVCDGLTEAANLTGVNKNNITNLAKKEREKNGYIFSFNEQLGQSFNFSATDMTDEGTHF